MKRLKAIALVGIVGLVAYVVYTARLYVPVTPQERDAIALDVYEAVVRHVFDPIADLDRVSRKFALVIEGQLLPRSCCRDSFQSIKPMLASSSRTAPF